MIVFFCEADCLDCAGKNSDIVSLEINKIILFTIYNTLHTLTLVSNKWWSVFSSESW